LTPTEAPPHIEIVSAPRDRLEEVSALWQAMHEYHAELIPASAKSVPLRSSEDAWRIRHGEFASMMEAGEAWLWIAERSSVPVGFAFARVHQGDWAYATDGEVGELEALSVEPKMRRWGIGSLLLEAVDRHLSGRGVGFIGLRVVAGNEDAMRLYERWGIVPSEVRCLGRTQPRRY
jgi:GNAT superfamily N-acetyltransferase